MARKNPMKGKTPSGMTEEEFFRRRQERKRLLKMKRKLHNTNNPYKSLKLSDKYRKSPYGSRKK
jgi:hypothetical protein